MAWGSRRGANDHRVAAGLFALLVLAYLWPALLAGHVLSPASVLYEVTPWRGLAPADVGHYTNRLLDDVPLSYYPWDVLARRLIHAHVFPAWNPHAFAGTPFFANPEVAWLSPFSLPLWILPLNYGLGVAAALKLWMGGFGAYLLVRELRLGFWPGILAGIGYALCAFDVAWLSHGVHVSVAVLLPWAVWLVERIVRRGRAVDGLALAGIAAFVLTGGHPGTQLHVLTGAVLYAGVRLATDGELTRRERLQRLGQVGAALAVGALVCAVTLLPAERAATGTIGAAARRNGAAGLPGATLPLSALRAALFPDWWGRPSELPVSSGPANYNERALYAGSVVLVLAVVALVSAGGWRRKAPFALLGAIGLAVPLGTPGIKALVVNAPLFDRVQNQRLLLWFLFAVAILSAFGLQAVLDAPARARRAWGVVCGAALIGICAAATASTAGVTLGRVAHQMLRRSDQTSSGVFALASVGWWLVFVTAVAACLLLARRRPERRRLVGGLVAFAAALDMLHFAHGYQPMGPASKAIPPRPPVVAFLRRHAAQGRILGIGTTLENDWPTVYGLRDVRGYDAPQPSRRFYDLWRTIAPRQPDWMPFEAPQLIGAGPAVSGMLGARYLVVPPESAVGSALRAAYRGRDAAVLENELAAPRALVARRVEVATSEEGELARVTDGRFDPRRDVVVRRDELGGPALASGGGSVHVTAERNATVALRAHLPRPGLVLLDDAWARGWSVTVDGRPARALQADMVLRAVVVPAGTHRIVWRYAVPGLRLGAALSGAGLLAVAAWVGWLLVRARRRLRPGPASGASERR